MSYVGIALVLAGTALTCWSLLTGREISGVLTVSIDQSGLSPAWAALVLIVASALLITALAQIAAMMRAVEQGRPFTTGGRLRRFAFYLFLSVLASILLPPLILGAEAAIGGDPRRIHFALDNSEALILFVTGLLFFVARLLEAAQAVAQDHEQIV